MLAIPLGAIAFLAMSETIFQLVRKGPPCMFFMVTGWYCPACGGTRSAEALLHGNIVESLRYHVVVVFSCLLGIAFYIEFSAKLFGKNISLVPRSYILLFVTIGLFLTYFVVRNFIPYLTP